MVVVYLKRLVSSRALAGDEVSRATCRSSCVAPAISWPAVAGNGTCAGIGRLPRPPRSTAACVRRRPRRRYHSAALSRRRGPGARDGGDCRSSPLLHSVPSSLTCERTASTFVSAPAGALDFCLGAVSVGAWKPELGPPVRRVDRNRATRLACIPAGSRHDRIPVCWKGPTGSADDAFCPEVAGRRPSSPRPASLE